MKVPQDLLDRALLHSRIHEITDIACTKSRRDGFLLNNWRSAEKEGRLNDPQWQLKFITELELNSLYASHAYHMICNAVNKILELYPIDIE